MQRKRGAGNIPAPQVNPRQLSLDKTDRVVIDYKKSGLYRPAFGKFHKHRMSGPEESANALLDEAGWVLNESTGIREKDGQALSLKYTYDSGDALNM